MKKVFFAVWLLLVCYCPAHAQSVKKISKAISACQLKNDIRKRGYNQYHQVRLELHALNKLTFLDSTQTVFFLETYDLESGTIIGLVWNTKKKLNYSYHYGEFSFDTGQAFTNHMVKLVESWNVAALRQEEKRQAVSLPPASVYATRVDKKSDGSLRVDCVMFDDFFLLDRDRFGYTD